MHGFTKAPDERRPFDVTAAKQLMADAGYPNGFSIQLDCPRNPNTKVTAICGIAKAIIFSHMGSLEGLLLTTGCVINRPASRAAERGLV